MRGLLAARDAASLTRELFRVENFTRDNLAWPLTVAELQRSQSHVRASHSCAYSLCALLAHCTGQDGDLERLRCFLEKMRQGHNLSIGVVGGSVSAGRCCGARPSLCMRPFTSVLSMRAYTQFEHGADGSRRPIPQEDAGMA